MASLDSAEIAGYRKLAWEIRPACIVKNITEIYRRNFYYPTSRPGSDMLTNQTVVAVRLFWRSGLAFIVFAVAIAVAPPARAQAGFDDDRVMLQGFYRESSRHGYPQFPQSGSDHWYTIIKREASTIRAGRFDPAWLPPSSASGEFSAGYNSRQYFMLDNSYGDFSEHQAAVKRFWRVLCTCGQ